MSMSTANQAGPAIPILAPTNAAVSDMTRSAQPPIVGILVDHVQLRGPEDIVLDGDHAYVPCREGHRLTVCNVNDPTRPSVISSFMHPDLQEAAGFAMNGNLFYVASQGNHRLLILDAHDKRSLKLLSSVGVGNGKLIYKVAYRNGYCFVAGQSDKQLYVVDVRDSQRPAVIAQVPVTTQEDGPFSVTLHGSYALVGTLFGNINRLAVVAIANPSKPVLTAVLTDPYYCTLSGSLVGDSFYANSWSWNCMFVFDVSDPTHPREKGRLTDSRLGQPNRCLVADNRAYLPMVQGNGIAVVDISDPTHPRFLRTVKDPLMKKTYGVALRANHLFVVSRDGDSLVVLDRQALEAP